MRLLASNRMARPLLAAALAAACLPATMALAETTTVTGISVTGEGGFKLTVPTVETTDGNLSEAAIRAIFSGDFAGTAGELAGLDAASIRVPEIRIEYDLPAADGKTVKSAVVYRDLKLSGVADGVARSASVGSAEVDAGDGATWTFGRMSSGLLDIGGILGFYGLGDRASGTEIRPVYADFVFDGIKIASPEFNCDVGGARVAEFSARPLQHSFQELMVLAKELEAQEAAGKEPAPEAIAGIIAFYVDFLTAFRSSPTDFDGFTCAGKDAEGAPLEIRSGSISVGGFEPGTYPQVALNDFRIDVENDGWMEFGNFTWKAMDFSAAIATLEGAGTKLDEAWFVANWRKLMPVFDGLSISGFGMDIPDKDNAGERIQASIGSFDVSLGDYRNGIPAQVALSASDIEVSVPPEAAEGSGAELAALGIDKLNLDYDVALHWDEASETIVVDRFALSGADIGSVELSGTLGNATAELFSTDVRKAMAASHLLTLKDLHLEIVDEGLSSVIIAVAAKEEKQEPAAFRAILSGLAQALPLAMLGATEEAMSLGTALRSFIDGRPNLKLTLTARDPAGISLADLQSFEKDPTVLNGKVSLVAEASGEPRPVEVPAPTAEPPAGSATDSPATTDVTPRQEEKQGSKQ
jgi:hypothetical protein